MRGDLKRKRGERGREKRRLRGIEVRGEERRGDLKRKRGEEK